MVTVKGSSNGIARRRSSLRALIWIVSVLLCVLLSIWVVGVGVWMTHHDKDSPRMSVTTPATTIPQMAQQQQQQQQQQQEEQQQEKPKDLPRDNNLYKQRQRPNHHHEKKLLNTNNSNSNCPITSISMQLSPTEVYPMAGTRHMVTPPNGGRLTLVCCHTSQGSLSVLLHQKWAPLGVARFVDMVQSQYFSSSRPPTALFRCTDACQFGLAGDPVLTKMYSQPILDDVQWLPAGPNHRENALGIRRYPAGMLTFAGSGPDSRSNQFVLTLKPNRFMGGGSPWEVPLGELVGNTSFVTMSKFYTGYGEHGPGQGLLRRQGTSQRVKTEWPKLDYITSCSVVDAVG